MNMVFSHWSASPLALLACAAVAATHLRGMRAAAADARRQGRGRPAGAAGQAVVFYLGMLAVAVALVSPVGYWAQRYIWIRSIQDVLLAMAAPGLIVLGAPWLMLARGIRRRPRRDRAGERAPGAVPGPAPARAVAADQDRAVDPRGNIWLTWPVAVTVAFSVAWWGWHVPALYDAALRYPGVYAAEVVSYLGLGIGLWLQLIGSGSLAPQFPPLRRVMLVVGTLVSTSVLAIVLVFGSWRLYPAYAGAGHHVFGVVADQQVGGGVLWVLSLPPFFIVAVALLSRWLKEEGSEALTSGFDRLLKPKTSAWPSRPGLR
jgi:cytochrome c oxidase assembly factor CtaG